MSYIDHPPRSFDGGLPSDTRQPATHSSMDAYRNSPSQDLYNGGRRTSPTHIGTPRPSSPSPPVENRPLPPPTSWNPYDGGRRTPQTHMGPPQPSSFPLRRVEIPRQPPPTLWEPDDRGQQTPQPRMGPPQPSFSHSPIVENEPLPPSMPAMNPNQRTLPPTGSVSVAPGLDQRFVDAILTLFGLGSESEKVIMTMMRAGSKSVPSLEQADLATRIIQLAATLQVREMLLTKDLTAPSSGLQEQLNKIAGALQDQQWKASEGLAHLLGHISRKEVYKLKRLTWKTLATDITTALKVHPQRTEYDIDALLNDPVRAPKLNSLIKKAARIARDGLGRDFRDSLGLNSTQRSRFKPLREFVHNCNVKYRQLGRSDSVDMNYLYRDAVIRRYVFDTANTSESEGKESEGFWDQVSKHLTSMTEKYGIVFTDPRWRSIIEEHLDVEEHQFDLSYIESRSSLLGAAEEGQDVEMEAMSDPTAFLG